MFIPPTNGDVFTCLYFPLLAFPDTWGRMGEKENYIPEDYVLKYSDLDDENSPSVGMKTAHVRRLICHPKVFNFKNEYQISYDIGIVQLKDPVELSTWYFPSLPLDETFPWDITEQLHLSNLNLDNAYPASSREAIWYVLTKIVRGQYCQDILGLEFSDLFCIAYEHVDGRNNCTRDIGSGLVVRAETDSVLVGLLISKRGCGMARSVAGCVKVSKFLHWIEDTVARYES